MAHPSEFDEQIIRQRAYHIWEREGCPEGRALEHWQMARSELAIQMEPSPTLPNPAAEREKVKHAEPVEPLEAVENQGSFPGLTDQDEERQYPHRRMQVKSPAFNPGDTIPLLYTCEGEDLSPPLEWRDAPDDTRSFLVYCEDPDAPQGTFHHWAAYDIPPDHHQLEEGAARGPLHQGVNDFGKRGYGGPCPPPRHGTHHYHFRLCALSTDTLPVPAEASVPEVVKAARPYLLAEAEIVGEYSRA